MPISWDQIVRLVRQRTAQSADRPVVVNAQLAIGAEYSRIVEVTPAYPLDTIRW